MSLTVDAISQDSLVQKLESMKQQMQNMAQDKNMAMPVLQNGQLDNLGINALDTQTAVQDAANTTQVTRTAGDGVSEFEALLRDAFEQVNILQNTSSTMQSRFDVGDRSITLADVMIASQKSSISFEATMQVRNKMVDAYKTIMQMQI